VKCPANRWHPSPRRTRSRARSARPLPRPATPACSPLGGTGAPLLREEPARELVARILARSRRGDCATLISLRTHHVAAIIASLLFAAPVKLGVINSMTGRSPIGENLTNGIKLARKTWRRRASGRVVWEDDTGKPQESLSAMEKLATRDNVAGVVGPYTSAAANAVAKLAERYRSRRSSPPPRKTRSPGRDTSTCSG